jgi:hypothetical protein
MLPEKIRLPASPGGRHLPVPRIMFKTFVCCLLSDLISPEFGQYHKFRNAVAQLPFLHIGVYHDKSQKPACLLLFYKEGVPLFFCKIRCKPWVFK